MLEQRRKPRRHQRSRAAGWRKPKGAVIVDRTSRWGNPYSVAEYGRAEAVRRHHDDLLAGRLEYKGRRITVDDVREHLAGRDLVCFCGLGEHCHADTLINTAND